MTAMIYHPDEMCFQEDHGILRQKVSDFVAKEMNANLDEWEEKGESPLHDLFKKLGDPVTAGEPLYRLYAQFPSDFKFARELCEQDNGYRIGNEDAVTSSFVEF